MRKQVWEIGNRYMNSVSRLLKSGTTATTVSDFYNLLEQGGELVLATSINLVDNVAIIDKKLSLDLNNKTVIGGLFTESGGTVTSGNSDSYAFWVKEGGELTINGDGIIQSQSAKYSMAVWAQGGTVIINDGKYYNNGEGSDLIYASAGGKIYIYGGEFHANEMLSGIDGTANKYSVLNVKDADYKSGISEIVVYGGKFYGFNPADNLSEGSNTNFVAAGYLSIEVEPNVWEVIKDE